MKLLLYSWQANNELILADNLIKLGFEIAWLRKECKHFTRDMELAAEMIPFIHKEGIEVVVSFDYFPIISMICNTCQVPYYAWVYDCPHFTLYAKQMALPCNHIGIFDREMVERLKEYGVNTVYHVPLSVDVEVFRATLENTAAVEREKYSADISFVGSLYADEHNYYDMLFGAESEELQETGKTASNCNVMNEVIAKQSFSYDKDYLQDAISQGTIDMNALQSQMEKQGLMLGEDYFARPEDILKAAVLEKKVTVEERRILLAKIAEKAEENPAMIFKFFTSSNTKKMLLLHKYNCGRVDYKTQMPLVFAGSKINLNISLRSIHSGIPLRVLDIMACGGFVLTNWQPEIEEYFVDGAEIVMFHSLEECMEKIDYYLQHEEERKQIAEAGRKKVQEAFSYQTGLTKLFEI